jgi:hypothetical protein
MRACAQVLQTNRRITRAGNTVWATTKRHTDRALDQPKKLLALFHAAPKEADAGSDDDVEGAALESYRSFFFPSFSLTPCQLS